MTLIHIFFGFPKRVDFQGFHFVLDVVVHGTPFLHHRLHTTYTKNLLQTKQSLSQKLFTLTNFFLLKEGKLLKSVNFISAYVYVSHPQEYFTAYKMFVFHDTVGPRLYRSLYCLNPYSPTCFAVIVNYHGLFWVALELRYTSHFTVDSSTCMKSSWYLREK